MKTLLVLLSLTSIAHAQLYCDKELHCTILPDNPPDAPARDYYNEEVTRRAQEAQADQIRSQMYQIQQEMYLQNARQDLRRNIACGWQANCAR